MSTCKVLSPSHEADACVRAWLVTIVSIVYERLALGFRAGAFKSDRRFFPVSYTVQQWRSLVSADAMVSYLEADRHCVAGVAWSCMIMTRKGPSTCTISFYAPFFSFLYLEMHEYIREDA